MFKNKVFGEWSVEVYALNNGQYEFVCSLVLPFSLGHYVKYATQFELQIKARFCLNINYLWNEGE